MTILHSADWLVPVIGEPITDGALLESDGVIIAVGRRRDLIFDDHDRERRWSGVIIPGLVNAHAHLQYSHMADLTRRHYDGFYDWVQRFQARFTAPGNDWYAAARDGARQALATGTTAVADVVTSTPAFGAMRDVGLKGIGYWEVFAWSNSRWRAMGRANTEQTLREHEALPIGISPHAPHTVDDEVLMDLSRLADRLGLRRHIHLSESAPEVEFVLSGTGPQAEILGMQGLAEFSLLQSGGSGLRPAAYLDRLGGLGPNCHVAHGVYLDAADRAILRRHQTAVALCPRSNSLIGLDEPPVADFLNEGNLLAVGTDSLASTPSLDLLADVGELARMARRQGYAGNDLHARLLEAATLGGARAIGFDQGETPIGALTPGYAADFAVVDVSGPEELVESGAGRVTATVIDGEPRHQGAPVPEAVPSAS